MNNTLLQKALTAITEMTPKEMEDKWNALTPKYDTREEIETRISMLSDEMDANEEENRSIQQEIDSLYGKLDAIDDGLAKGR